MGVIGAFIMGFIVGIFAGILILGLFQMIRKGDDLYEEFILGRAGEVDPGEFREPFNHFEHFNPHRDRRVCAERRRQSGETSNIDYRLLHHVHGNMGVSKGSGE